MTEISVSLREILEAEPADLADLILRLEVETSADPDLLFYARFLLAYWRCRIPEMKSEWEAQTKVELKSLSHDPRLSAIARLRLAIRENKEVDTVPNFEAAQDLWAAEGTFVLAMYFETRNQNEKAQTHYQFAEKLFFKHEAFRKSAKAYHNSIAALSRIDPDRRLIPEYQEAVRRSRNAGDWSTVASALNNLSREFQLMGALRVALRNVDEALVILRERAHGSYSFYMALCHRAHLHLELGHRKLATTDFEEASAAEFPEIIAALKVIREWMERDQTVVTVKTPEPAVPNVPTWEERKNSSSHPPLSQLESLLIRELADGPKDRHSLIQALWGTEGNFFHLENRLKQLIHRFRKKEGELISFAEGRYYLADRS
jgi:tetratricopeptide (TPR) repeat protein